MKWNGIVSHPGHTRIATRFATANAAHATSTDLRCSKPITRMPNRLDRGVGAELLPQPADADVDDVRTWIEVVSPHLGQEPLATDDLAGMLEQVMKDAKFAV